MTANRVTLDGLDALAVTEIADLPLDQLAMLLEDVAALKATAKQHEDKLLSALDHRFSERARELRHASGKDTGRVRISEGQHVVVSDLPKKVMWDPKVLRAAVETIQSWGEDPREYVSMEIKVSEAKFNAWPKAICKLFESGRTVKAGRATYEIMQKDAA